MDIKSKVSPPDKDERKTVLGYPPSKQPQHNSNPNHYSAPGYPIPGSNYHPHPGFGPPPPPYPAAGRPPGYPSAPNYYHQSAPYSNQYPPPPHLEFESRRSAAFARIVLCLMVFLILGTAIVSLLTFMVFGSDVPMFRVETFKVPEINISDSALMAKWEATVTVENPNYKLDIIFEHVDIGVGYHNDVIIKKPVEPFQLSKNEKAAQSVKIETPAAGSGPAAVAYEEDWRSERGISLLKDMKRSHDVDRTVMFDLILGAAATFKSGSVWSRRILFKVVCPHLKTEFKEDPSVGVWDGVRQGCIIL